MMWGVVTVQNCNDVVVTMQICDDVWSCDSAKL